MKNQSAEQRRVSKKLRPGPVSRNPYLNFCREFRMNHSGLTAVQLVKKAAIAWAGLNKQERIKYVVDAFYAKKRYVHRNPGPSSRRLSGRRNSTRKIRRR